MADPLSVAASVIGLVSFGVQSTECLVKYYTAHRNRDSDLARTLDRLSDLLQLLRTVDEILRTRKWQANETTILQRIEEGVYQCEDAIHELQNEAQKLQKGPTDTLLETVRATGRRAAYPFRQSTLKKLEEDVEECRHNLSIALQGLQLKVHQNTQDDLEEMKNLMKKAQAQHLATSVQKWLKAPDATVDYNTVRAKRHPGTGQWFVQSATFTTWLYQDNSFLWLYGFAGCGKSVLFSTAIQHAFRHLGSQNGSAVAFFFFTFRDESKQDVSAMLRALLLQLSGQIAGVDGDLTRLKDASNYGTPPVPTLLEYLRQAVARGHDIFILLDALDECQGENKRDAILSAIRIMRQWQLPGFHLLVTSRDLVDIRKSLDVEVQNIIALKHNEVNQDILRYVSFQVEHDPQLMRWGDHRDTIKQYITQHANGVFRWVECQLRPLRKCAQSVRHLNQCLRSLPKSLDETYQQLLCEIGEESWEEAQRILTLLCLSSRPLCVAEVIDAIAVDVHNQERYDSDLKLENSEDLLRICPGLIEIHADIIRIAHFSVQEYLLSDRITSGPAARFAISEATGHLSISKTCLIYLCNEDFLDQPLTPDLVELCPFARYAAQYWHHHYLSSTRLAGQLTAWGLCLLTRRSTFVRWVRLHDVDENLRTEICYDEELRDFASPVYYVALLGLDSMFPDILSSLQADVNAKGGDYGNALQAASRGGHEKVVKMLLDAGADVNAQGGRYGNALYAASVGGNEIVVKLLLDAGADVNAQGGRYGNALYAASYRGNEKVVKLLLDAGTDVNAQGGHYGNAIYAASYNGYEKVVEMLLDAGADVNAQGGRYGNALQAALYNGHEKVVEMLLDAGADVNAQGGQYGNALQAALYHGHEKLVKMVEMLLDAGADVNAQGGHYGNALYAASYDGHEKVVKLLLDAGADVNAQGGRYGNALQVASYRGHGKVVKMLLDAGADVNAQGGHYGNALQAASYNGYEKVVEMLLDAGADVNAQGGCYGNALQAVSGSGNEMVVKMLLDAGAV